MLLFKGRGPKIKRVCDEYNYRLIQNVYNELSLYGVNRNPNVIDNLNQLK